MARYSSWPTTNQGSIVGARLSNEIYHRFTGALSALSMTDQTDGAIAELLATTPEVFNVKSFGAKGDGTTDDAAAIQTAIDAAGAVNGTVIFPAGTYLTLTELTGVSKITMIGEGGVGNTAELTAPGATRITGKHTGSSVLSLKNTSGVKIRGIDFHGSITTPPKTGILLGRPLSLSSSGSHRFYDVQASGYFTKAAVYSIASENNRWDGCQIVLNGGDALYCYYTSQSDDLSVASMGGASNIDIQHTGLVAISYVNLSTASCIFMNAGVNTISHKFIGGWLGGIDGSYITVQLGNVDATSCPGPITFIDISGERLSGSLMDQGFNFPTAGSFSLSGLTILGCRFPTGAGGKFINQQANASILDSIIKVPAQNNSSTWQTSLLVNTQVDEGAGTSTIQYGVFQVTGVTTLLDDVHLTPNKKYFLDIGGDTFIFESAGNNVQVVAGGAAALNVFATGVSVPGTLEAVGVLKLSTVTTLADEDTPSVAAGNLFKTGGTTTITDFDDGVVGQTIRILSGHAITITDGTNILLSGSANFVMAAGDVLVLTMYNDQVWVEDSRQVN